MTDRRDLGAVYTETFRRAPPAGIAADDVVLQHLLAYAPGDRDAPVLDAGCGHARYALKLVEHGYHNVTGVDLFDASHLPQRPGFRYVRASITQLPFADHSFDFAYSGSVLYHLDDPQAALTELFRVLRPGGHLVMTAHTRYSLHTLNRILRLRLNDPTVQHLADVHFRPTGYYLRALHRAGFHVVRQDGYRLFASIAVARGAVRRLFPNAPFIAERVTGNRLLAKLKSHVAYHMVLVAQRR